MINATWLLRTNKYNWEYIVFTEKGIITIVEAKFYRNEHYCGFLQKWIQHCAVLTSSSSKWPRLKLFHVGFYKQKRLGWIHGIKLKYCWSNGIPTGVSWNVKTSNCQDIFFLNNRCISLVRSTKIKHTCSESGMIILPMILLFSHSYRKLQKNNSFSST